MDISTFFDRPLAWSTDHLVLLTLFAIFEATAALLLAFAAVTRRRRRRRELRDEEVSELKARLSVLEACEQRRTMQSLNRPPRSLNTTAPPIKPEDPHNLPTPSKRPWDRG